MQLDANDPLLKLAAAIPWQEFDEAFSIHYTKSTGVPSKSIRELKRANEILRKASAYFAKGCSTADRNNGGICRFATRNAWHKPTLMLLLIGLATLMTMH